jgi:hypothetical protein
MGIASSILWCDDQPLNALSLRFVALMRQCAAEKVIEGKIIPLASELGGFAFGRRARITCQVPPVSGKVVDIERGVELGDPFDSKGLRILAGHLVDVLKANPS